jgi:hypothetical protein
MEARLTLRRLLSIAALGAAVVSTSGCGGGSNAKAAAAKDPPVKYADRYLSFAHPAAWKASTPKGPPAFHFVPLVFLSTQPVGSPCQTHGNETDCGWPIKRLRPGGVLITWEERGFPGFSLKSQPGSEVIVGGRSAKRSATRPGACGAIGGELTIQVAIARPAPDNWTEAIACIRGPGVSRNERRVDALLASTKFLAP